MTLIIMVAVCGAVWGQIDDPSIDQRWKTSHTGGTNQGKWTKIAECNITHAWQDCGATFSFFGNGGGGSVIYYGELIARFKNQNSTASPINKWKLLLQNSNFGVENVKAIRNNTKVEVYIRIPESHTSIFFRRTISGTSSITAVDNQPFLEVLPSGDLTIDCQRGMVVSDNITCKNSLIDGKLDVVGNIRLDLSSAENGSSRSIVFNGSNEELGDKPSCRINMVRVGGGAIGQFEFQTRNNTDEYTTTTRLKITPDGKVAVGDHTPSAKLDVAGNIKAHEIEVTLAAMQDLQLNGTLAANNITYTANGNTADFVFEDHYHLKDLSEVEAFIKANKHLPEIPSAAEMEEAGVNLAEMNKLLLMKVEELTLYSIEQEKKIEARDEKVESLELKVEELSDEKRAMRGEIRKLKEDRRRVTELEERLVKMESLLEELSK